MDQAFVTHYNVPTKGVNSLSFSPNGKKLLVSSLHGGVLLYNIDKQNRPFAFQSSQRQPFSPIRSLMSPNGEIIYSASTEGKIAYWKMHNAAPSVLKRAHPARINDMSMWQATGRIVTASNDKSLKIWEPNLEFYSSFSKHTSQVTACCCNPVNDIIISGDAQGNLSLFSLSDPDKEPFWTKSLRIKDRNSIVSVDFDHSGVIFCASTLDKRLSVWDLRAPDHSVSSDASAEINPELIQSHQVPPSTALFHPRKPYILASGGEHGKPYVGIINLEMSQLMYSFEAHECCNTAAAWSPNGKLFATADQDGVIIVWKMPRYKVVPTLISRSEPITLPPTPPPTTAVTPEVLITELNLLNQHVKKLNDVLERQESRLTHLAECYPSVGGFTSYEC